MAAALIRGVAVAAEIWRSLSLVAARVVGGLIQALQESLHIEDSVSELTLDVLCTGSPEILMLWFSVQC